MSSAITRLGEQCEAKERTAPKSEARESTASNSEVTLHRTKLPLRRVKLENAPLQTTKARESTAPSKRRYSLLDEARESTAPSKRRYSLLDEARECTAPNSEATLYRS
jgi:hypothetical protein